MKYENYLASYYVRVRTLHHKPSIALICTRLIVMLIDSCGLSIK